MKKQWNVTVDGENYAVEIDLEGFLGKLTVTVNGDAFPLPPKFLTILFGRKERLMLGEKLALLVLKRTKTNVGILGKLIGHLTYLAVNNCRYGSSACKLKLACRLIYTDRLCFFKNFFSKIDLHFFAFLFTVKFKKSEFSSILTLSFFKF